LLPVRSSCILQATATNCFFKEPAMALLTPDLLRAVLPRCQDPQGWAALLDPLLAPAELDQPLRLAAFLAQAGHESGHFNRLEENLHYSAEALRRNWPKRFPDDASAQSVAGNPEAIANRVYGGRLGNGPEASGDGWTYRGRGVLQITGKSNYLQAEKALGLGLVDTPDRLAKDRSVALATALWFWNSRGLSALADANQGDDETEDFREITHRINGGEAGWPERLVLWGRAKSALGV
jgi:putative chitinase